MTELALDTELTREQRECIETAVFLDLEDARRRIGHFIDYYNFQRPHQGIEGDVLADRCFRAAAQGEMQMAWLEGNRGREQLDLVRAERAVVERYLVEAAGEELGNRPGVAIATQDERSRVAGKDPHDRSRADRGEVESPCRQISGWISVSPGAETP